MISVDGVPDLRDQMSFVVISLNTKDSMPCPEVKINRLFIQDALSDIIRHVNCYFMSIGPNNGKVSTQSSLVRYHYVRRRFETKPITEKIKPPF